MSSHERSDPGPTGQFRLRPISRVVRHSLLLSAGLVLAQTALAPEALASPEGGVVAAGQGTIQAPNANTTIINQQSHSLSLDWQSFNLDSPDLVQFNQPSASASVLNRVLNGNASQILGTIQANGRVFIMNPSGIVFGQGSVINVNSLFATSLIINTNDFMAGNYNFSAQSGQEGGAVVNQGFIQAAQGGSVTLVGGSVSNEGVIVANYGQVNLAAGRTATVEFDGDGLLLFAVDGEVLENAEGVDAAVKNTGEIRADGGQILLTAKTARDVFGQVVNNSGVIKAGRIENKGGKVFLTGLGGPVTNTGTINVSATAPGEDGGTVSITGDSIDQYGAITADAANGDGGSIELISEDTTILGGDSVTSAISESGGKGGTVHALGDKVGLFDNATVDVSGDRGGGEALVGGDYRGLNTDIQNATATFVSESASIKADAKTNGNGGKVILWADNVTKFYGEITAKGGDISGDGGFVEVSGKQYVVVEGMSCHGSAGIRNAMPGFSVRQRGEKVLM